MDPQKIDPLLTVEIVGSYVRHHAVGARQLADLIASVHRTLAELGQPNPPEEVLTPAVSVRQSVRHEFVICLDCGYRGKTLRRHISNRHGLTRDEYLRRWGLRRDHLLTAPAYSERRSALSKELGLGRKATAAVAPPVTLTVSAPADTNGNPRPSLYGDGALVPDRSLMPRVTRWHSLFRRGRGDGVLGLPRHNRITFARRPNRLNREIHPRIASEETLDTAASTACAISIG